MENASRLNYLLMYTGRIIYTFGRPVLKGIILLDIRFCNDKVVWRNSS